MKNKKIFITAIVLISAIILTLVMILFTNTSTPKENLEEKQAYIQSIRSIFKEINSNSEKLVSLDPNDTKGLIQIYDSIILATQLIEDLKVPEEYQDFHYKFQNYMYGLKTSYQLIKEGALQKDFQKITTGLKELSSLDNSFLQELEKMENELNEKTLE